MQPVLAMLSPARFDGHEALTLRRTALSKELGIKDEETVTAHHSDTLTIAPPPCPAGFVEVTGRSGMRGPFHYVHRGRGVTAPVAGLQSPAAVVLPLAAVAWAATVVLPHAGAPRARGWAGVDGRGDDAAPRAADARRAPGTRRPPARPGLLVAVGGAAFDTVWTLVGALLIGTAGAVRAGVATVPSARGASRRGRGHDRRRSRRSTVGPWKEAGA